MVRCLRWSFLVGDLVTVSSSISQLGHGPYHTSMSAAVLIVASVSLAWTIGGGILHGLHKAPEILTFADVT